MQTGKLSLKACFPAGRHIEAGVDASLFGELLEYIPMLSAPEADLGSYGKLSTITFFTKRFQHVDDAENFGIQHAPEAFMDGWLRPYSAAFRAMLDLKYEGKWYLRDNLVSNSTACHTLSGVALCSRHTDWCRRCEDFIH